MSAVLILLAQRYGLDGVFAAGFFSGVLLLLIGLLKLGRFIAFIPAPVIAGFTSGIAVIIALGQIDNLLGVKSAGAESALGKLLVYWREGLSPDWHAVLVGGFVIALMALWPARLNTKFPASLLAIILTTLFVALTAWPVVSVGEIPHSLVLTERLTWSTIPWSELEQLMPAILTITALGAVESLLCGAVASTMTGVRLQANQELVAQGIGNILLPFFGGVPATAAIARTSVGIKSGGQTRLVSIFHALLLLASIFILAPLMSRIPLAALAGVLIVTAWRMNEWDEIHFYFQRRFATAIVTFLLTLLATVALDLTQAIIVGSLVSAAVFMTQVAELKVEISGVDLAKLKERGIHLQRNCSDMRVAYLTGPLFFAAAGHFNEAFAKLDGMRHLILSMRGVSLIDTTGLQVVEALAERLHQAGGQLYLAGIHDQVLATCDRGGLLDVIGRENVFWSADRAIVKVAGG